MSVEKKGQRKPSRASVKAKRGVTKAKKTGLPGTRGKPFLTRSMEEQRDARGDGYRPITDEDCPF